MGTRETPYKELLFSQIPVDTSTPPTEMKQLMPIHTGPNINYLVETLHFLAERRVGLTSISAIYLTGLLL